MLITETKTVTEERVVVKDVLCNKCGETCIPDSPQNGAPHGLVEANVTGGYHSTHIGDCESHTFSLCEKCLVELFATFKIPTEHKEGLCWPG